MVDPQIRGIVGSLEVFTERVIRKISTDITANLLLPPPQGGTPVATGWARANWIPSIGVGNDRDLTGVEPDAGLVSAASAQQQAGIATVVTRYRLRLGAVFISNNVPYIVALNDGSSQQAPAAFVQRAIMKAVLEDFRGFR